MSQPTTDDPMPGAAEFVPATRSVSELSSAAQQCRGCPLYRDTTQAVFGEGATRAAMILVGEQPGDVEDRRGHPFVGPAGAVLWRCVEEAGIDRHDVFTTNAVKHFKHEVRGKRRLHKKPNIGEVDACRPWLSAELAAVDSPVIVALGATAARSVLGKSVAIARSRETTFQLGERMVVVTYHPSAVLRADEAAAEIRAALVHDLRRAHSLAP
jgi:uracil-DNA glycosylase family protein